METGYRPEPIDGGPARGRSYAASVALYLLLSLVTLGIFNLYWNWRQMQACNGLLERREFSWLLWVVLSVLTLGIYHLYYQYKMGSAINEIQHRFRLPVTEGLPVLSLVATLVSFGIIADCVHQLELNKIEDALERRLQRTP